MAPCNHRTDLPILLLHNLDPSWGPADAAGVREAVSQLVAALRGEGHRVIETPVASDDLKSVMSPYDPLDVIVLNWCEALPGHPRGDVRVAHWLERHGYTFTGCPAAGLSLSWDKAAVKASLAGAGVPTPAWRIYDTDAPAGWPSYPAIVKPAYEHCSIGVDGDAVVLDEAALRCRVRHVRRTFRQPALVEDFIDGREFHVTLWGNAMVRMLPPAEMDFSAFSDVRDRLCTYDSKFTPGSVHYEGIEMKIPADLTPGERSAIARNATAAYRRMGCRDYARLDLRLREGVFYVLDVNPNPDISPDTSLACGAEAAGLGYGAFIGALVHLAGERHPALSQARPGRLAGRRP